MSDLNYMPAYELAAAVRSRELSAREVVESHLERIEQLNPTLNAFVALGADRALQEARALDESLARGAPGGPLCGVPVGIKDIEDVEGLVTSYGSVPFRDNLAKKDSVHVARLRGAGAIIIGKTNTPEFAYAGFTKNRLFGVTRNPWNRELTPGGSSGGSAAAVASGMAAIATGTDRGGSIRIPASYTGCFGLKPSFGRVPRGPLEMLTWSDTESIGALSRTVEDAALYLDCVAGHHSCDPDSLPKQGSYFEALPRLPSGLAVCWSPTLGYARVEPDIKREAHKAAQAFEDFACRLDERPIQISDISRAWSVIGTPERYAELAGFVENHRDEFGRAFLERLEAGGRVTTEQYGEAQRARSELNAALAGIFDRYDLLLTPATATAAFDARGRLPDEIDGQPLTDPLQLTPFTYPFNLSGHPAACVRAGFTDTDLPVGLQIVGPRHRDDLVLQASYAFQQCRPWNDSWPSG